MKLNRILITIMVCISLAHASPKPMNININDLNIDDLIKITSRVLDKNILLSQSIPGKVSFITNKPIYEEDLVNILIYVLEEKGFTIVDNNNILRVVRMSDASRYNLPVFAENVSELAQMVTNVFEIESLNVDYAASKIMHLISRNGRVVTDKNSNSLIITDFPDNIHTIKVVIDSLSKDKSKDMIIYPLQNTTAQTIAAELRNIAKALFDESIETQKVDILFNADTNSIIMIGNQENILKLHTFVKKIDIQDSLVEHITKVIGLKNTEAKNIQTLLNSVLSSRTYQDPSMKPFLGVDEETNTVVLIGPKAELLLLENLINELDVDRPQVYVKAQIIEVSENKIRDVGMQYGLIGGRSGGDGLIAMSSNLNSAGFRIPLNLPVTIPDDLTAGLALSTTINLLQQNGAVDVVSEPSILAINNKESSIYVGQRRSIKTGSTVTDGGNTNTSYTREDIGLTLSVKPRISNDNKVILEISTLLEDVIDAGQDAQPTTTKREVSTTSIVSHGESVILGGLVKDRVNTSINKVPFLGDIPLLGRLFRNEQDVIEKMTLVVVITPYIVSKSGDLATLREQLTELALLEERYLQELELRRQENLLNQKQEDALREKKMQKVDKKLQSYEQTTQPSRQSRDTQLDILYGR